jgi:hypothetical protein
MRRALFELNRPGERKTVHLFPEVKATLAPGPQEVAQLVPHGAKP